MEILRQRKSKGTLRTVWRDNGQIVKEFRIVSWPPDFRRPWRREHRALSRLNRSGVPAPETYGSRYLRPATVQYRRQYIAGELLRENDADRLDELAHHFAAIHAAGVTNGDVALDNILVTEQNRLVLIDYGRARVSKIMGPIFFMNIGKELARIRRRIFRKDLARWQRFLERYARFAEYPSWGWSIVRPSLTYWLRRWGISSPPGHMPFP